jgi:hypothetical protein
MIVLPADQAPFAAKISAARFGRSGPERRSFSHFDRIPIAPACRASRRQRTSASLGKLEIFADERHDCHHIFTMIHPPMRYSKFFPDPA